MGPGERAHLIDGGRGMMVVMRQLVQSPIGALTVELDGDTVIGVRFGELPDTEPASGPVAAEFDGYFAGDLTAFAVPVEIRRGSAFERAVWAELCRIPYGEMRTYGQVAAAVGDSGAARAVGVACNRNPVPVIVPCHRVVGADGKLVGFGGGLPMKRQLLELEARVTFQQAWS
jgi:methylated-DNA-[protein]-cysteine S-methyltransferase